MNRWILHALMLVLFALVLFFSTAFLAREYTKVDTITSMGDIWSFIRLTDESAVFTEVDMADFPAPPLPAVGDSLLTINGLVANQENYFSIFTTQTPPGTQAVLEYKSADGEIQVATAVTRSIPAHLKLQIISLFILRTLFTLAIILVGFWAFQRRPDSLAVAALALFCWSLAVGLITNQSGISDNYARFELPELRPLFFILVLLTSLGPAFWLLLQLRFPETNRFYTRRPWLTLSMVLLPGLALTLWGQSAARIPALVPIIYNSLFFGLGYYLLWRNYSSAESFLARRQTWLVLWGSGPALLLLAGQTWVNLIAGDWMVSMPVVARFYVGNITLLVLLLIPISFAVAFGRYRLLEVEARLKRGTRILAVNILLLLFFFGILYLFGEIILKQLHIESRTPTLAVGLVLALSFAPAQGSLRRILENRFYPERVRLRTLLREFLRGAQLGGNANEFWQELEKKLADGIATRHIHPVLCAGSVDCQLLPDQQETPFHRQGSLVGELERVNRPLLVDELIASGRVHLTDAQTSWLREREAAVLLPMATTSGLLGFLVLGQKINGDDYAAEELELLNSLANQIALAAENNQLLADKIEKQKLEKQLEIARTIQEGLLPQKLPQIPQLELAARIRFCQEVAGDYYDVIPLPDGCTLLAIGDVAGKGVGPALLMANLQASLRAVQGIGISLTEVMARINALVHGNTPAELFITLFVAVYDPTTRRLSYVNAGHNPPVLVDAAGDIQRLTEGGLILGVDPLTLYAEGHRHLAGGDTLLMFTDGVSEAMNAVEDEFGEDRIAELTATRGTKPLTDLLQDIEGEVTQFRGSLDLEDDFTLLAASFK